MYIFYLLCVFSLADGPPDSGRGTFTTEHTGTGTSKSKTSEVQEQKKKTIFNLALVIA